MDKERTQPIVRVDDVATYGEANTDRAVIRPHRWREATLRPAEWMVVQVEERVLLLDTEPRLVRLRRLEYRRAARTMIVNLGSVM